MKDQIVYLLEHSSIFIGILLLTLFTAFLVKRLFSRVILNSTAIMHNDPTNYIFLRHAITGLIYTIGFSMAIYSVPSLRTLASSLLAGAGILAVAIGLASRNALSNVISGIFIVMFKPFRVHDRLRVREYFGIVEDITLRHTVMRDFENKRILIPNTLISDEILVNSDYAEGKICEWIEIKISLDSDVDKAKAIMVEEVSKHPFHTDVRSKEEIENGDQAVPVRVLSLDSAAVNLRIWAWTKDPIEGFEMSCDLYERIKKRFDVEGIQLV